MKYLVTIFMKRTVDLNLKDYDCQTEDEMIEQAESDFADGSMDEFADGSVVDVTIERTPS